MMISLLAGADITLFNTAKVNPTALKTAERQPTPLVIDSGSSITEVGEFPSGTVEHRGSGRRGFMPATGLQTDSFTKSSTV
jgi:hypothetical protein